MSDSTCINLEATGEGPEQERDCNKGSVPTYTKSSTISESPKRGRLKISNKALRHPKLCDNEEVPRCTRFKAVESKPNCVRLRNDKELSDRTKFGTDSNTFIQAKLNTETLDSE